jgi:hypothetical protein
MDLGSLLLLLALLLLAALFVARPLLQPEDDEAGEPASSSLQAERERILDALAELDADWELGKVPEEIYRSQRQQLVAEGAAVLQALEASVPIAGRQELSDAKLDALIAAHKAKLKKARK